MHLDEFVDHLLLATQDPNRTSTEIRNTVRQLAGAFAEAQGPLWRYPEEEPPEEGEWVVFVTDQCAYRIGRFGYDNLTELVLFLDTDESPYLVQHVLMWHPLPVLPPSIACDLPGVR